MPEQLTDEQLAEWEAVVERAGGERMHYELNHIGVCPESKIAGPTDDIEAALKLLRWAPWAARALRDARDGNERLSSALAQQIRVADSVIAERDAAESERDALRAENAALRERLAAVEHLCDASDEADLRPAHPDFDPIEIPWTVAVRAATAGPSPSLPAEQEQQ